MGVAGLETDLKIDISWEIASILVDYNAKAATIAEMSLFYLILKLFFAFLLVKIIIERENNCN